jgi:hypothetical protein
MYSVFGVTDIHKLNGRIEYSANVSTMTDTMAGRMYMIVTNE